MSAHAPIRIGVIGAGSFASRRHLPDLLRCSGVEVAALCRRDPEQLARVAAHFGVGATYTDYRRMLAEEPLDAVLIATPHTLHFEQAREALEQGLHVLLEKPMCVHLEEARALARLAAEKQRQLVVALNPPYWKHIHQLRQWVGDGRLGSLESVNLHWLGASAHVFGKAPMPETMPGVVPPTLFRGDPSLGGGGQLIDGGSHMISELLWATGLRIRKVSAFMDDPETEMCVSLMMEADGGVPCTLTLRGDSAHPERRIGNTYLGSKATAVVEGMPWRLCLHDAGTEGVCLEDAAMPAVPTPAADFVAAIRGESTPLSGAEHGAAVVAVVEAAYRSARSGKVERVAE